MSIDYKVTKTNIFSRLIGVFIMFFAQTGFAGESNTTFSGFANFGVTYAKSDQLEFRTSVINASRHGLTWQSDTVVGLQMNSRLDEHFDFVGQIILQDRYDYSVTNILELAFLRVQMNRNWSAKVGRFSTNGYLLTDYRYVRHAQYWARTPLEMYSPVGVLGNMNGLELNYVKDVNFGTVKVGWSIGRSEFRNDGDNSKLRITYQDLNSVFLELQTANWRIKASHVTAILDDLEFPNVEVIRTLDLNVPLIFRPFALEVKRSFLPEGVRAKYSTIGATYQGDDIEFIAEFADYDSDWALAKSARSGYTSFAYNYGDITPFITLAFSNRKEFPQILDFAGAQKTLSPALYQLLVQTSSGIDDIVRGASIDQDSVSIGLRWDINMAWALKFQFDHNRTNDSGSGLFSLVEGVTSPREGLRYNVVNFSFTTTF